MSDPVEHYLWSLIEPCQNAPLLRDLRADQLGTPAGTASIARAALCWLRDGRDAVVAAQLRTELEAADRLTAWRLRQMSHDLADALDWAAESRRPSLAELRRRRQLEEVPA